ncbi:MAG: diaminopimelate epimerase [Planctomycetota bacterium]|jgi:diaminopimelate epimerase|nr:MAG: diaminopimelate epimerase [Planctomycetota bacterium]
MKFLKMHGAANDYVYVDCFEQPAPADPAALAPRIADRHRGVGGDGLVLVQPSSLATARMRMFNADGSESEMCGNGVRCVAHMVVARGRAPAGPVTIETGRGVLTLEVVRTGPRSSRVRVDMGAPLLEAAEIPVQGAGTGRVVDAPCTALGAEQPWWQACGLDPRMTCVSMGNPHVVLYCRDVAAVPLAEIGPRIETHASFPRRVNVHFVEVLSRGQVRMRTWERGSGITMACGTGASAVCVAGVLGSRTDALLAADLPGGRLDLEWAASGHVFMTGPAQEVFEGTWWEA